MPKRDRAPPAARTMLRPEFARALERAIKLVEHAKEEMALIEDRTVLLITHNNGKFGVSPYFVRHQLEDQIKDLEESLTRVKSEELLPAGLSFDG